MTLKWHKSIFSLALSGKIHSDKICFFFIWVNGEPFFFKYYLFISTGAMHDLIWNICSSIWCQRQYLQLQPGRRLPSHSIHLCASQPFGTVGRVISRSETDETLQVLPGREIKRDEPKQQHAAHCLWDRISRRNCCTYPHKALTRRENAQTEGQQDPTAEVAVAIVVILKLLADLTVNLIPGQTTDQCSINRE